MSNIQNNINIPLPQPLRRTLSEHHWKLAEQLLDESNRNVWAGTFNGKYDTWEYWVTKENNKIRRHSFSEQQQKEFIVEVN